MFKQSESGPWPAVTALVAALAPAAVKFLVARRSRAPIQKEREEMCRNHSHLAGRIFALKEEDDVTEVRILVTQPLTVEASNGTRLTLPRYAVCSVRVDNRDHSAASALQEMAAQDEPLLSREGLISTSGPIIQPK